MPRSPGSGRRKDPSKTRQTEWFAAGETLQPPPEPEDQFPNARYGNPVRWASIGRAQTALCAENEKLLAPQLRRIPAHAGVLREAENVAARAVPKHIFRERADCRQGPGPGCGREKILWRRLKDGMPESWSSET